MPRHSLSISPTEKMNKSPRGLGPYISKFIPRATARRGHRGIRPMVYILKAQVSSLRLMANIWTASSDAARARH